MKCNKCGNDNFEGAKYCSFCGSVIEGEQEVIKEAPKKCMVCGNVFVEGCEYCPVCGSKLEEKTIVKSEFNVFEAKPVVEKKKEKLASAGLIFGIISLALVGFIYGFIFGIISGVLAIVFSIVGLTKKQSKKKCILGLIFGIVGFLVATLVLCVIVYLINNPEIIEQIQNYINDFEQNSEQIYDLFRLFK